MAEWTRSFSAWVSGAGSGLVALGSGICLWMVTRAGLDAVAAGTMEEMQRHLRSNRVVRVRLLQPWTAAQDCLFGRPEVSNIRPVAENGQERPNELLFDFAGDDIELGATLSDLVRAGIGVVSFHEERGDLEDVFLKITQGIVS
mgnify:CR=1 FL=1